MAAGSVSVFFFFQVYQGLQEVWAASGTVSLNLALLQEVIAGGRCVSTHGRTHVAVGV